MKISGKVTEVNIGPGCWGIVTKSGKEYRIVNMPAALKQPEKEVTVTVQRVEEMSIYQWGEAVEIISIDK